MLFTELAADLAANRGRVGLIIKSGIAIDAAQSSVWDRLVRDGRVREVRDVINGGPTGGTRVFQSVAPEERFSLLVLGVAASDDALQASMMNMSIKDATERPPVRWTTKLLRTVCPATETLLSAKESWEIDMAAMLHKRWPTLDFDRVTSPAGRNPWGLSFRTLFHSSGGQKHFHRREDLEADGWVLQPNREFRRTDGQLAVPVFEGQMLNRYDHRAKTYEGYEGPNKYGRRPNLPWVTDEQHADPSFEVEPRYWMLRGVAQARLRRAIGDRVLVAYRDVTRSWREQRSVKAGLLFPTPATHKLPILAVPAGYALRLVALLNSTVFDFLARVHVPGASLQAWVLSQCAAPRPDQLDPRCGELAEQLSVTSQKLADAYHLPLHQWEPDRRLLLEAECDARVARSYGLTHDQYEQLFDHFIAMARVEQARFGQERTRRLCLEAFDRLEQEG